MPCNFCVGIVRLCHVICRLCKFPYCVEHNNINRLSCSDLTRTVCFVRSNIIKIRINFLAHQLRFNFILQLSTSETLSKRAISLVLLATAEKRSSFLSPKNEQLEVAAKLATVSPFLRWEIYLYIASGYEETVLT